MKNFILITLLLGLVLTLGCSSTKNVPAFEPILSREMDIRLQHLYDSCVSTDYKPFGRYYRKIMMNTLNAFENLNKNDTVIIIETSDSMSRGEYRCHFYLSNDSIEKYRFYAFRCDHQPVFDKKKGRGFPIYSIATNCRLEYIPPRGDTSLHPIIEAVQNDNIEEHIAVESERGTLPCIYYMVSVLIKNPKGEYDYRGYYYHTK